jgi:hypothetical protein
VFGQEGPGLTPQIKSGVNAKRVHFCRSHRSDAVELPHTQIFDEGGPHLGRDDE